MNTVEAGGLRAICREISEFSGFVGFFFVCILANTVVLSMDHHNIDKSTAATLNSINFVLTILFTGELAIKLVGYGETPSLVLSLSLSLSLSLPVSLARARSLPPPHPPTAVSLCMCAHARVSVPFCPLHCPCSPWNLTDPAGREFFDDGFNNFDFVIVIVGLVELVGSSDGNSGSMVFRVCRVFRVFRILRTVSFIKPLRVIFTVIIKTSISLIFIICLLVLFVFIFAVAGMQLFGGNFAFPGEELPTWHFDNFPMAFMTVFQILTYDNWNKIMCRPLPLPTNPYSTPCCNM
eukprot:COSAG05_NODE_1222_length_5472_cov_7.765033_4_plen_293_part_00